MSNKDLFIDGYITKISKSLSVTKDEAFEVFSIAAVLDRSFQDIYSDTIIKGTKDGGIDGVYFQEQGDYYIMHVFQCKQSNSLKPNQIDKFRNDFKDIFINGNQVQRPNIEDLIPKIDEYKQLSTAGYIIEPKLYFLYRGENDNTDYAGNIQAYNAYHDVDSGFEIWDSKNLYGKISLLIKAQSKRNEIKFTFTPENSNITPRDNQALYSYSIQNVRAANFRIKATQLCQLIEEELSKNFNYDFLFSENIRGYLGMRARANKKMSQTIDDPNDAVYFPFLNNGITIICEKLILPSSPQNGEYILPTINPVIVNGLQTTRVIYSKYKENKSKINDLFLNVRLYETDEPSLIDKITDATNTQTPINFKDKISNKDFNAWAKEFFEINDIAYITKRGETFSNKLSKEGKESINSDTILKYWYASFYEKPEIAKNSISIVLETIYDATNSNNPLNKLFEGSKNSALYPQFLIAYKIYKKVQSEKEHRKHKAQFIAYADELITYGIYKIIEPDLKKVDDSLALSEAYSKAYKTIEKNVQENIQIHKDANKAFSYPGYFKRPKSKVDFNTSLGIIESENLIKELVTKR